jgi:sulfatase modifying factor 1
MKKVVLFALILTILLSGCGSSNNGELTGVQGRKAFFEPEPLEMAFIPAGNYMMGPSDQDVVFAMNSVSKSVTKHSGWTRQRLAITNTVSLYIMCVILCSVQNLVMLQ